MWHLLCREPGAAIYTDGRTRMRFAAYAPNIIRVTHTGRETFLLQDEPIVTAEAAGELTVNENHVYAGALAAQVLPTGDITWMLNGELLLHENGHTLREIDVIKYDYDLDAPIREVVTADGVRTRADGTPLVDRKGYQTRLSFSFAPSEAIYGLGQHEEGLLNYRGQHQFLYQNNLKIACPVIVSSGGWAILHNNGSAQVFHDDAFGSYLSADCADELDYFVIAGPEFDTLVAGIRQLTGDAPLLPRWTLGYVQSKEHYHTADELTAVAHEYRRRGVPLDCVVQDWQTWPGWLWGQKTVDETRYPDLKGTIDELHDENVKLMISIWPNMVNNGPDQLEFLQKGQLLGNGSTYNAFDPEARKTYWEQCNRQLFASGVDAWWCDCTEPFEFDWYGAEKMFPEDRMRANVDEFKRYIDPAKILHYSIHHARAMYEGQRGVTDEKRVVNLTRSGMTGQQRYAAICWNGDVSSNWETLKRTIADGLNLCVCGLPYWTVDAGGFFSKGGEEWFRQGEYPDGCRDEGFRELYTRWIQLSALLPMMRSHGADTPREIWQFGEKGEPYYDAIEKAIRLRYRLIPYLYSEMAAVHFDKSTMLRMLAFDFRTDETALNIKDQFMLGRCLMAAPILTPMQNGAATRKVYLPMGCGWYDFMTRERYEGGRWLTVQARIDEIPLFVREGSILPMGSDIQHTGEEQKVTFDVYPGADAVFPFYNDAGDGYAYERGEYERILCRWSEEQQELSFEAKEKAFP